MLSQQKIVFVIQIFFSFNLLVLDKLVSKIFV